jgi:hypothetical protein
MRTGTISASVPRHWRFFAPEVLEQQVVIISFDKDGIVSGIDRLDKENGNQVQIVERTTPTAGAEMTFLQQMFGNLGRFNAVDSRGALPTAVSAAKAFAPTVRKAQKNAPGISGGVFLVGPLSRQCASAAKSRMATMLMILIIGFTAGPAVSL